MNEAIDTKQKEIEEIEKDRLFFKGRVERLEDKLLSKEKQYLQKEAEKEVQLDERLRSLNQENLKLKEDLIIMERVNARLHRDLQSTAKSQHLGQK